MTQCPSCGHTLRESHRFCSRCGAAIAQSPRVPDLAIAALVLSIVPFCLHLGGIVLGVLALRKIAREPTRFKGRGIAIAAIAIGCGWIVLALAGIGIYGSTNSRQRAKQGEARILLHEIHSSWTSARAATDVTPSTFAELGFKPESPNRYTYFLGDDVFAPKEGVARELPDDLPSDKAIVAAAVGTVGWDEAPDVWFVTESGDVVHHLGAD